MLASASQFSAVVSALGLIPSLVKPLPTIIDDILGAVDGVASVAGGVLNDLPIVGGLLEVEGPSNSKLLSKMPGTSSVLAADLSCFVEPYNPPAVLSQTFPPFDQAKANIFRYRQQQAVNLGSWFVHEQWMTPSVFRCASDPQIAEIDIASGWKNTTGARAVLERHWDTFINQSDFEYLSSIGINTVRLPIGYWSLGPLYCKDTPFEPYADVYQNAWSRVVRAINWAGEYGIGVLVDLHGAPGSQNGQPHSGISDGQANLFGNATYETKTTEIMTFLVQQLATVTNVVGIQMLNEPNNDPSLPDFYTKTIDTMRNVSTEAGMFPIYIHDAFNLEQYSDYVSKRKDFVVEDHHSYFVFSEPETTQDAEANTDEVKGSIADQLEKAANMDRNNLVVGEWSCALEDDSLKDQPDKMLARQQFCQGQQQVYANTTSGWFFWSYTKEDCEDDLDWCFKNAVNRTLPATFFSYGQPSNSQVAAMTLQRALFEMTLPSMAEVIQASEAPTSSPTPSTAPNSTVTNLCAASSSSLETTTTQSDLSPSSSSSNTKNLLIGTGGTAQHRFDAVHARRSFLSDVKQHRRSVDQAALQRSVTKGFSDGFLTAKIFAQYGMSKLAFEGQYVSDSIAALGPNVVAPGTEIYYSTWFARGLKRAETLVSGANNQ